MRPDGSSNLGKTLFIRGEISGAEELYVDGTVEGSISLPGSRLVLGPNANVHSEMTVQDIVIQGRSEGNIAATGRVELRQTASVHGNLSAARLSIEEGAGLKGNVTLTGEK